MTTEPITPEWLDLAVIMAAHHPHTNVGNFTHCIGAKSEDDPHCLPYRLAAALADRDAQDRAWPNRCRNCGKGMRSFCSDCAEIP